MNKIPKIIVYSWFGNNPKPKLIQDCIDSWKRILHEYEIIELNENTWDINKYKYSKQAYEQKRWAFVSDIARIDWLYSNGGISFDADIRCVRTFPEEMLSQEAFTSTESSGRWISAVIAAKKGSKWIHKILKYYRYIDFEYNPTKITNTVIIDKINKQLYKETIGDIIYLHGGTAIYKNHILEAKDWSSGKYNITDETITVHEYEGSWIK